MIEVLAAGALTTVQDAGRVGWRALGVPAAGPADWLSHTVANRLVGNPDGTAALECTLAGPRLRFRTAAVVAVVGAAATLDGAALAGAGPHEVPGGGTLAVGRAGPGVRGYVAVAGGIDVPPVLGSRSTDTLAGLGPPRLAAGARLPVGAPLGAPLGDSGGADLAGLLDRDGPLRIVPGPHADWFDGAAMEVLCGDSYSVTPASDRVGVRLAGAPLPRCRDDEPAVTGLVAGAVQVPPDGQPILLLANHGPTGGYPLLGAVATADLPVAAQARPGSQLRFTATTAAAARAAYARLMAELDGVLRARRG